jgi:hypothetical protein
VVDPRIAVQNGVISRGLILARQVNERPHFECAMSETGLSLFWIEAERLEVLDEADILVGADGIHSAVRHQLYPAEGEPRFAQQVLWRAACLNEIRNFGRGEKYPHRSTAKPGPICGAHSVSIPGSSAEAGGLTATAIPQRVKVRRAAKFQCRDYARPHRGLPKVADETAGDLRLSI